MNVKRVTLWVIGVLGILLLNLGRDVNFALKKYRWEPIITGTLHRSVANPGVLEAVQVVEIKSQVDETVIEKSAAAGDPVKKGQVLMKLSRTRTQLEYEQKRDSFLDSEADHKKAIKEVKIMRDLFAKHAVPRSQVDDAVRNAQKAGETLDIARRELDIAKAKLESTTVVSPLNGVVLKDNTKQDMPVNSGLLLITVGDVSHFIVRTKVDELDMQQIRPGQKVEILADAYPGRTMKGVVQSIATEAERDAFARVEVVIDVINANGLLLKHNLSVRTKILTEDIPQTMGIAVKAILRKNENHAWVLVRNRYNMIHERRIEVGPPAGDEIEVVSGLQPGDRVGVFVADGRP